MGNTHHKTNNQSFSQTLWQLVSSVTLGAISSSLLTLPVYAEGTFQLGPDPSNTARSFQGLFEYQANYNDSSGTTTGIENINRPIYVDVKSSDEIINIAACGLNWTDDWSVDVYYVGPELNPTDSGFDYNDTYQNYPPASGTFVQSSGTIANGSFGTGTNDANNQNCNQYSQLTNLNANTVQVPATSGPGIYEIRLNNLSQNAPSSGSNNTVLNQFDISVTNPVSPSADIPAAYNATTLQIEQGRVWSYVWAFNARGFGNYTSHDFYVLVPGGEAGTNFVWQLDLDFFAGFVYEMIANAGGVRSPNAAGTNVRGLSVPIADNDVDPQYRQYLTYPDWTVVRPTQSPEISNLRFVDSDGQDNVFSPGSTTPGVQQTGTFEFSAGVPGTYEIILDINGDGIFGDPSDVQLRGDTDAAGNVSAEWDGRDNSGVLVPTGSYNAQVRAIVGEYHFVAGDVETSGGNQGNGITIEDVTTNPAGDDVPVYWDDLTILGTPGESNIPTGGEFGGNHIWGTTFGVSGQGSNNNSWGDREYIDTYVYGAFDLGITPAVVINDNTTPNPDDPRQDYGDAPDIYSTNSTAGDDGVTNGDLVGAAHSLPLGSEFIHLGANAPDGEEDPDLAGANATNALGDDNGGSTPDDEDGVTSFSALAADDSNYSVTVNVRNTFANSGATTEEGYLVGWIDFNRDGQFDASEGTVFDSDPGTAGVQGIDLSNAANDNTDLTLTWDSLSGLVAGDTYARFRISTDRNLVFDTQGTPDTSDDTLNLGNFFGAFIDGEVEDYQITIDPASLLDYGDAPDSTAGNGENDYTTTAGNGGPFHVINAALKMGDNAPDPEDGTATLNTTATTDDVNDTDGDATPNENDEDGVILPSLDLNATTYTATVNVTNTTGSDAYLVGWIDFDESGTFDTDEGILYDADPGTAGIQPIATGTTDADVTLTWPDLVPLRTGSTFNTDDNIFARFRLTDTVLTDADGAQSIGALGIGEVEDSQVSITSSGEADLVLVKRITAVRREGAILGTGDRPSGQDTSIFNDLAPVNDPSDPDNDPNWPTNDNDYLFGALNAGEVKPGDEIEYTIYFLNSGSAPAENITLCDVIPPGTTYVPSSMELFLDQTGTTAADLDDITSPDAGNLLTAITTSPNSTTDSSNDGDRAAYFAPGITPVPSTLCERLDPNNPPNTIDVNSGATNTTGAVIFTIVDSGTTPSQIDFATAPGEPPLSYGFIRFRAVIQ